MDGVNNLLLEVMNPEPNEVEKRLLNNDMKRKFS
jgi:hypothetical protein